MEAVLDALAALLSTSTVTVTPGSPPPNIMAVILGDVGMGPPTDLPFCYIAPLNDRNEPTQSTGGPHGVDMDRFQVPILVVYDRLQYSAQVPAANPAYSEQPGYRPLMQLGQNIRAALRANITLGGVVATSLITEMRYALVSIDNKAYRGLRITWEARQRRGR